MRRLVSGPAEVDDLHAVVAAEHRPAHPDRPWLLVNMISSLDGAIAVDNRSGGLGRPADKALFHALRAVGDVVLVGAGTARSERYGPARPPEHVRAQRIARAQAEVPTIAVVSRSLALDLTSALFTTPARRPIVITCAASPTDVRRRIGDVADVLVAGDETVDLTAAMAALAGCGADIVTCEGGPRLNGDLLAADLIDEWALTISPLLVGGDASRSSQAANSHPPRGYALDRVLEGDGLLLTRWVRDRD